MTRKYIYKHRITFTLCATNPGAKETQCQSSFRRKKERKTLYFTSRVSNLQKAQLYLNLNFHTFFNLTRVLANSLFLVPKCLGLIVVSFCSSRAFLSVPGKEALVCGSASFSHRGASAAPPVRFIRPLKKSCSCSLSYSLVIVLLLLLGTSSSSTTSSSSSALWALRSWFLFCN